MFGRDGRGGAVLVAVLVAVGVGVLVFDAMTGRISRSQSIASGIGSSAGSAYPQAAVFPVATQGVVVGSASTRSPGTTGPDPTTSTSLPTTPSTTTTEATLKNHKPRIVIASLGRFDPDCGSGVATITATATATDPDDDRVVIEWNTGETGNTITITAPPGTHQLHAIATDEHGTESNQAQERFTVRSLSHCPNPPTTTTPNNHIPTTTLPQACSGDGCAGSGPTTTLPPVCGGDGCDGPPLDIGGGEGTINSPPPCSSDDCSGEILQLPG